MSQGPEIKYQAITPMTQSMEASCVPTAISMVFSGFGMDIGEDTLIEKYFPSARLPAFQKEAGVNMTTVVIEIAHILRDANLERVLQPGVFLPFIWQHVAPTGENWIVRARAEDVRRAAKKIKHPSLSEDIHALARSLQRGEIEVYSVNRKLMRQNGTEGTPYYIGWRKVRTCYYNENTINKSLGRELVDFVRRGHAIGAKESISSHVRVIDGVNTSFDGFWIVDPGRAGDENYHNGQLNITSLIRTMDEEFATGMFDYLITLFDREQTMIPQPRGARRFFQAIRGLIP